MISPTTVTTLPLSGFWSTPAATVVWLHGCFPFWPILPSGLSHVPFSGVMFGNRMSAVLTPATNRQPISASAIKDFCNDMACLLVRGLASIRGVLYAVVWTSLTDR